jgi:NitT/TauT family transport system permease protein
MTRLLRAVAPPLAVFALFLVAWHWGVAVFRPAPYLVPAPAEVWARAREDWQPLLKGLGVTALGSVAGFAISVALGTAVALLFSQSRFLRAGLYPYAIFFQTVPVVAIAPLLVVWFGYGFWSVLIITSIVCVFPVITNGTTGMLHIDRLHRELFEIHGATRWQLLWKLRVPGSVPFLVAGAKISAGLSVIGCIVGELFAGAGAETPGLGTIIYQANAQLHTDYVLCALVASTALGFATFQAADLAGDLVLRRWRDAPRD